MGKEKNIIFKFDEMKEIYQKMNMMEQEALLCYANIKEKCEEAEDNMKGQYKDGFKEQRKDILKAFKKNIQNLEKLASYIEGASVDAVGVDNSISRTISKQ